MAGLNKVQLMGNLTKHAEVRHTQAGQPVTSLRIACNERYYAAGENRERVEYVNCVIWGKRGEAMVGKELLLKGQGLFIQGRLQTRQYKDQTGADRWTTEVVVGVKDEDLQLIGGGARGSQTSAAPPDAPPPSEADAPGDDFADAPAE